MTGVQTCALPIFLQLSDRIAVLCAGKVVGQCGRKDAKIETLGLWMAGVAS